MEDTNHHAVEDLNFLISVNSDRIDQYQAAREDAEDEALRHLFQCKAIDSGLYIGQLGEYIKKLGGRIETGTTLSGDLHRIWVDIRSALSGHEGKAILEAIDCAEKATLTAYDRILAESTVLPEDIYEHIQHQRDAIDKARLNTEQLMSDFQKQSS